MKVEFNLAARRASIYRVPEKVKPGGVGLMGEKKMELVFVAATRTPFIKEGGPLKDLTSTELATYAARGAIKQAGLEGREDLIDLTIMGNAFQTSRDAHYFAGHVAKKSFIPDYKDAFTVNNICFSAGRAIILGAQQLILEEAEMVLVGGGESFSQTIIAQSAAHLGRPVTAGAPTFYQTFRDGLFDTITGQQMMQTAENLAQLHHQDDPEKREAFRKEVDEFVAFRSQKNAAAAQEDGRLAREITPVELPNGKVVDKDDCLRPDITLEEISRARAVLATSGGVSTGLNSSGIVDGGTALIMTTLEFAQTQGLTPLGRLVSWGTAGVDPAYMGIGPVPASYIALERAGLKLEDMQRYDINEAFGAQVWAVALEMGLDLDKLNVNGGAIALGHPLGATVGRIATVLLMHKGYGLGSACAGGGPTGAFIIEGYGVI